MSFRANSLKISAQKLIQDLTAQGFKPKSWIYPNTYYLAADQKKQLQKTAQYQNGELYLQSLASMLPVICLQPQAGEAVLDLTAAPGSKSSQIASLMQNQGSLTAIELDYIRCQRLTHNLNLLGVDLVNYCQVHQMDALQYLAKYPKQYDKILLDAPCTSSARIIADQKKTYTHKSLHQSLKFSKLQLKLLTAAFTQLKTGGKLVYSTCSLHPAENHFVVQAFLKSQAAAQLKQVEFKNLKKISYNIDVDPQILTKTFQVMPDKFIESFYIASITRKHA